MKVNRLILCLGVAGLMAGCSRNLDLPLTGSLYEAGQVVADVTKQETMRIAKGQTQGDIYHLAIDVSGEVKGEAEISLMYEDGKPYRTEKLSGPVSFQWQNDWYTDNAEIQYTPSSVTGGTLRLTYTFKGR